MNNANIVSGFIKGDKRSLDSTRPLVPNPPIHVKDIDQFTVAFELTAPNVAQGLVLPELKGSFVTSPPVWEDEGERELVIDMNTGLPQPSNEGSNLATLTLKAPLTLYSVIEDRKDPTAFRMITVGTEEGTTFLFIVDDLAFTLEVPQVVDSTGAAVATLYGNALEKESEGFNAFVQMLPDLFYKLFYVGFDEPTEIQYQVWHTKGVQVSLKLYLYPDNPDRNILSGNNYCWHINLNQYPAKHIARGYSLRVWEEGRGRGRRS